MLSLKSRVAARPLLWRIKVSSQATLCQAPATTTTQHHATTQHNATILHYTTTATLHHTTISTANITTTQHHNTTIQDQNDTTHPNEETYSFGKLSESHEKLHETLPTKLHEKHRRNNKHNGTNKRHNETVLNKWQQFRDADLDKVFARSRNLMQDDDDEDDIAFLEDEFDKFVEENRHELRVKSVITKPTADAEIHAENTLTNQTQTNTLTDQTQTQTKKTASTFGQINPRRLEFENTANDEGDEREQRFEEARVARKHRPQYYGKTMRNLCKERKLSEALAVLEEEMPRVGARPNDYCYNVLISACGRAGYTKKAFMLYNQMKKRGLAAKHVTYMGLFNACANSPWPLTDGLTRATSLRTLMQEKGVQVNPAMAHAMIKAFGRCGDIGTAFCIVDEMVSANTLVTTETINFLLQACVSDTAAGFRHALMVWRKMRSLNLSPDIYSYNLLARCTKECGGGHAALTTALLKELAEAEVVAGGKAKQLAEGVTKGKGKGLGGKELQQNLIKGKAKGKRLTVSESKKEIIAQEEIETTINLHENTNLKETKPQEKQPSIPQTNEPQESMMKKEGNIEEVNIEVLSAKEGRMVEGGGRKEVEMPDFLGRSYSAGSVVALTSLDEAKDRLGLLGGATGFMSHMRRDRLAPDLMTATLLLDCLPHDTTKEEALVELLRHHGLEPDIQLCNLLIRRRSFRRDHRAAQEVLVVMQRHSLAPDLITFGCLALGCETMTQARTLLHDMDKQGIRANVEVMTALVRQGVERTDYIYALEMLMEMRQREVIPDHHLIKTLEKARKKARDILLKVENDPNPTINPRKLQAIKLFLLEYRGWLRASPVQLPDHPWAQYRRAAAP